MEVRNAKSPVTFEVAWCPSMRWAEIDPPRRIRWTSRPDPASPGPDQVNIQIAYSGLCGTDIRRWAGRPLSPGQWLNQGHEMSGVVTEIGCNVVTCSVGDRVCVDWSGNVGG